MTPKREADAAADEAGGQINYGHLLIDVIGDREIWGHLDIDDDEVIAILHHQAHLELPPKTRYEIRRRLNVNHGRTRRMSWYRCPEMDAVPSWSSASSGGDPVSRRFVPAGGYYLIGRFTTPPRKA